MRNSKSFRLIALIAPFALGIVGCGKTETSKAPAAAGPAPVVGAASITGTWGVAEVSQTTWEVVEEEVKANAEAPANTDDQVGGEEAPAADQADGKEEEVKKIKKNVPTTIGLHRARFGIVVLNVADSMEISSLSHPSEQIAFGYGEQSSTSIAYAQNQTEIAFSMPEPKEEGEDTETEGGDVTAVVVEDEQTEATASEEGDKKEEETKIWTVTLFDAALGDYRTFEVESHSYDGQNQWSFHLVAMEEGVEKELQTEIDVVFNRLGEEFSLKQFIDQINAEIDANEEANAAGQLTLADRIAIRQSFLDESTRLFNEARDEHDAALAAAQAALVGLTEMQEEYTALSADEEASPRDVHLAGADVDFHQAGYDKLVEAYATADAAYEEQVSRVTDVKGLEHLTSDIEARAEIVFPPVAEEGEGEGEEAGDEPAGDEPAGDEPAGEEPADNDDQG